MRVFGLTLLLVLAVLAAGTASAQGTSDDTDRGTVELGVLTGVTFFFSQDQVDFTGHVPSGASGVHAPVTPALRITFWTDTPFLFDVGTSFFSSDVFGDTFSAFNFEVGMGVRTTYPSRVVPSAALLLGFVSWSGSSATNDAYVGGQAGVRAFVNERTSFRLQLGYRHTLQGPNQGLDIDSLEVAVGLGVFL